MEWESRRDTGGSALLAGQEGRHHTVCKEEDLGGNEGFPPEVFSQ